MTFPREECRFRMSRTVAAAFLAALWLLIFAVLSQVQARGIDVLPPGMATAETPRQALPGESFQVAGVLNRLIQAFMKSGRKASKNADDVMEGTGTLSRGADDAAGASPHPERKTGAEKTVEEEGTLV